MVSFGAGDGSKDRLLLREIRASGKTVKYFPVDASQTLLEVACAAAEDDDFDVTGIKGVGAPVAAAGAAGGVGAIVGASTCGMAGVSGAGATCGDGATGAGCRA